MTAEDNRDKILRSKLNTNRLTPIKWNKIMDSMQEYAEHYHKEKMKETFKKALDIFKTFDVQRTYEYLRNKVEQK